MQRQEKLILTEQIVKNVLLDFPNLSIKQIDDSESKFKVPGNNETYIYDRLKRQEKELNFKYKKLFVVYNDESFTHISFSIGELCQN
jgi:hypothetical protein